MFKVSATQGSKVACLRIIYWHNHYMFYYIYFYITNYIYKNILFYAII